MTAQGQSDSIRAVAIQPDAAMVQVSAETSATSKTDLSRKKRKQGTLETPSHDLGLKEAKVDDSENNVALLEQVVVGSFSTALDTEVRPCRILS